MDFLHNLHLAFSLILQPSNLLVCFTGVLIGTLVGVLPGLGPGTTIALLIPATYHLPPVASIIMLSGIFYGAMYGGSTTSILLNIPGEGASVVTCLDGYQMARQGRAGPALGISAFGSFIAGTIAAIFIMFLAPPLAKIALKFGPPENFSLMILGMTLLTTLGMGSKTKTLMMAAVGVILGTVGMDLISGVERFTFGSYTLMDGLNIVPVVMGLFGVGEILLNLEISMKGEIYKTKIPSLLPTLQDWKDSIRGIIRGGLIGFFVGILPGGGATIASFAAYSIEKKVSKHPEKFGKGAIEGVAAPEAANNAAAQGSFIPLLALGLPPNISTAILLGALILHGVKPGPFLIVRNPEIFWGIIGAMYVGNLMLLVLNLPLIGMWVKFLKTPYDILFPMILLLCLTGVYSVYNNVVEVFIMIIFGILGYLMRKLKYEAAPLVLAFILTPFLETALRQSLIMSHGSFSIFLENPISLILLICAAFSLASPILLGFGKKLAGLKGVEEEF
jgi:putative tricarboxylic transport membrane protein